MNKKILTILVVLTITILTFFILYKINIPDNIKFSKEYNITKENIYIYKTSKEIIEIIKTGTGIIYIKTPNEVLSNDYIEILNETSKKENIKKIYYLNITKESNKNIKKIIKILNEDNNISSQFIFVNEGKIISKLNEVSFKKNTVKEVIKSNIELIKPPTCIEECDY